LKNILSYESSKKIKGKDIKEWIIYHTTNKTNYTKIAGQMKKYMNIDNEQYYTINKGNYQSSERNFCVIRCD